MFNQVFKDKKIIITGNTGFKGSWLATWLIHLGALVHGISKDIPTTPSLFEALNLSDKIVSYPIDIRDVDKVCDIFDDVRPDFVFHLAAQAIVSSSYSDPLETFSTNIMGTANILEALRHLASPCIAVCITSDKCYDNVEWEWGYRENDHLGGKDCYSGSKGGAELVFKSYFHSFFKKSSQIRAATARAGNVIGGGDWAKDRIVADCMRSWAEGVPVTIRNPKATRPWQHVLEPLSGYLLLAEILSERPELSGNNYNFGPYSHQNHTVLQLLTDLNTSCSFPMDTVPYKTGDNTSFHEAGLLKLNCDKALHDLRWLPTLDYSDLITFTGEWYSYYYKNNTDMFGLTLRQIDQYQEIGIQKKQPWAIANQ